MSRTAYLITHPNVAIDRDVPVPRWPLSERGRERMRAMRAQPWVASVRAVWSSTEQKALDGAAILAAHLGVEPRAREALGENDRSSTGFLESAEFEATADRFFGEPQESVRGWERAIDAQARMVGAMDRVLSDVAEGDVAVVAHGAVGTLYLCHLAGWPISRDRDQPGNGGGNYYAFECDTGRLLHGWKPIDPVR